MRAFFVSRCSFQFMKLLSFLFFIFQNHSIAKLEKKVFFQLFFQDFWNELFTQAYFWKTFSKDKKNYILHGISKNNMPRGILFSQQLLFQRHRLFCPLKLLVLPQWHPLSSTLCFQVHNNYVEMNLPAQCWRLGMSFRQNKKFSGEKSLRHLEQQHCFDK